MRLDRLDEFGVPLDVLERERLQIYFGRDWPADIFDLLAENIGEQTFDVYDGHDGAIRLLAKSLDFAGAQILASDNVARDTIIVGSGKIVIYVTDDNDIFYVCAGEEILGAIVEGLRSSGRPTDTERLGAHANLMRGRIADCYRHFQDYNFELAVARQGSRGRLERGGEPFASGRRELDRP